MSMDNLEMLFKFIGGLGMFLYGMNVMADGLQKSAGNRMKQLLGVLTNNRLLGVVVGALVTAIIQSSSATTVMVVGFVNAGILNLTQAVGVIMGANIGTTITAWIVSMSEWGAMLKPEFFAPLLIGIGAFVMLFAKKEKSKEIGEILVGFGVLFIGLSFMSGAITPYRDAPIFSEAFRILGKNPILGILTGAVVTGIIQSSSASVGILQTLALNGVVTWNSAIYITLGQNIGTCVTALLSSAGAQKTAKRAAIIHLLFNVMGAVLFGVIMFTAFHFNQVWAASNITSVQISIFHTIFNVTNTIVLYPFANLLVKLSGIIVKEKPEEQEEEEAAKVLLPQLDDRILESPSFAIQSAVREVVRMAEVASKHVEYAMDGAINLSEKKVQLTFQMEESMNQFNKVITEYLVKISHQSLTEKQSLLVSNLLFTVNDIERISDHCENIAESAQRAITDDLHFSMQALDDMREIKGLTIDAVNSAAEARKCETESSVKRVYQIEEEVDHLEETMRSAHIQRLAKNQCSAARGTVFLDILSNVERISDHANNVAEYVESEFKK